MLRVDEVKIAGPTGNQVPHVMQDTREHAVSTASLVAARTRLRRVVAAASNEPSLGQILSVGDAFGAVGHVFSGTRHGKALLGQVFPARNLRHLLN
jgi:hypothetical protein